MHSLILLITILLLLLPLTIIIQPNILVWSSDNNGNGKSRQLESLRTCTTERNGDINGPIIMGTPQEDTCIGTDRSETIIVLADDTAYGNGGDDIIMGNLDDDKIFGNGGEDLLQGDFGDDTIHGGGLNDVLIGGEGDDILSGQDGNDKLYGDLGNDILKGGSGANDFICGDGVDTVLDYDPAKGDTISNDCEIVNAY
jgi:Ca2+-binding RTX toxin-like protein